MDQYFAGVDIGSTMTKAVIMNEGIIASVIGPTGPEQRHLADRVMEEALDQAKVPFEEITYIVSTGYGRINVPFADKQVTEITCHAKGISWVFPGAATVIDVGGQDCKAIKIDRNGRPVNFVMNDKCAAGSGRFVEIIADTIGVALDDMGELSLRSANPLVVSSLCTIWAQQEIAGKLTEGIPLSDIVAGVHKSLAARVTRMAGRLKIEAPVVLTGGGAKNKGLVKAFSDELGVELLVPPEPLITGAVGAALLGKDIVDKAVAQGETIETRPRQLTEIELL